MPASAVRPMDGPVPIRLMVIDDSAVTRAVVAHAVQGDGRFVLAGMASTAAAAIELLGRASFDLILLDLALPDADGLTFLPTVISLGAGARVAIMSGSVIQGGQLAAEACAMGAVGTIAKSASGGTAERFGLMLVERLAAFAAASPEQDAFDLIAIGASTGGLDALSSVLAAVPATMTKPILVTQHLPASFTPYLAEQLAALARRPCDVARERARIVPGHIVLAPGDAHLRCVDLGSGGYGVRLSREPAPSGCTPSVDPMLQSVASACGSRSLAIVLSGMGRDGILGAASVRDAGGIVAVQDKASSVVWGMPGSVATAGLAHAVLSPEAIGQLITRGKRIDA